MPLMDLAVVDDYAARHSLERRYQGGLGPARLRRIKEMVDGNLGKVDSGAKASRANGRSADSSGVGRNFDGDAMAVTNLGAYTFQYGTFTKQTVGDRIRYAYDFAFKQGQVVPVPGSTNPLVQAAFATYIGGPIGYQPTDPANTTYKNRIVVESDCKTVVTAHPRGN